jgi:hypothetical protein
VAVIALAALGLARLAGGTGAQDPIQAASQTPRPEFYMVASYVGSSSTLQLQVRRTAGGAVTGRVALNSSIFENGLTAAPGDRAFYAALYPSCNHPQVTRIYRIAITGAGRIASFAPVGPPVQGEITDLSISPDGSRFAYNATLPGGCTGNLSDDAVHILDLATGAVRTWQGPASGATPADLTLVNALSWTPDGQTLVVDEGSRTSLTVFGLATSSAGGSLGADSTILLQQDHSCSAGCVSEVLAGPDGTLTVQELQRAGQRQARMLVVRNLLATGATQTVLYTSTLGEEPPSELFADPSGQWLLLWPDSGLFSNRGGFYVAPAAGWIYGGRLHPLPGVVPEFPQAVAW